MRIAQIAPLTEAIPPKLYGGTERVISWLTEELVALGHDVTPAAIPSRPPSSGRYGPERCGSMGPFATLVPCI
jgi:hypothetical protein